MSESDRRALLASVGNNPSRLPTGSVPYDLFTDVPPCAIVPDEARHAGEATPDEIVAALAPVTGDARLALATKGRAAEVALVEALEVEPPVVVLTHGLFSTTQAALARRGAVIEDLPLAGDGSCDVDVDRLTERLVRGGVRIVYLELANNAAYGWPLTEANVAAVRAACDRHGAKLLLDAARPLANGAACGSADLAAAARRVLAHAHAFTISCAKELLVPIGSVVGSPDAALVARVSQSVFRAGTSMSWIDPAEPRRALHDGIRYALAHPGLIHDRLAVARALAARLRDHGVEVVQPVTAHAVYVPIDRALAPPGDVAAVVSLLGHLYAIAGARGQVVPCKRGPAIRLAIPLRTALDAAQLDELARGVAAFVSRAAERPALRMLDGQVEFGFFRRLGA